jgi:tRNA A-37 threonylcarbamoyl transferase component Bud32
MSTPEERLLAVAGRVADGAAEPALAVSISEWDALRDSATEDVARTLRALEETARVAEAYRTLTREAPHRPRAGRTPPLGRWGHLVLVEKAGEGATAEVYRAHDTRLDHDVALKLFKRTRLTDTERQTILEEGRRHARVKHGNIATIHDANEHDGRIGISMEYIEGATLRDVVAQHGLLGAGEAAHIGIELCRALAAIHRQGLVHGDIKAQNVMREKGGRIVLMDFSTSRPLEDSPAVIRAQTEGTPMYMAPELFEGGAPSPASDVYALGVLLFHLATNDYPVRARTAGELKERVLRDERQSLYDLRPDLPPAFVQTVERALSADPGSRFPSVGALGGALAQTGDLEATPSAAADAERARPARLHPVIRGLVVSLGTVLFVGFLGFVSSTALNVTIGRPAEYAGESPADWLVWGLRALIAPVVYMALLAAALGLLVGLWRALKSVGPVGRSVARVCDRLTRASAPLHLSDPVILAQILFAVGLLGLAAICWQWADLIHAFAQHLDEAHADGLAPLRPDQVASHVTYGQALDLLVFVLGVAWVGVVRAWRDGRDRAGVLPLAATLAMMVAALVLWVTPYRILFQNEFEMVEVQGQRGYILGAKEGELLVYLPDAERNQRRVFLDEEDVSLRRLQVLENVFSP